MEYCTACQKAIATVVIMDLVDGAVAGSQHLCNACAEQMGAGQAKPTPKHAAGILEELLTNLAEAAIQRERDPGCPACGLTTAQFRSKGRLGCPRCYETYRKELLPLLRRIHEAQQHNGRLPVPPSQSAPQAPAGDQLAGLRQQLEAAVRGERYEEAAQLRDQLRRAERGEGAHQ